jgi:hypothetical protein
MSNDDYFAQRPGDGGQTPPTTGEPNPYAAPGQPGPYGNPAPGAPEYGSPAPGPAAPSYGAPGPESQPYGSQAYGAPAYGTSPYGAPGYGTPPGQPGYGYPYAAPKTNGLAIAALVVSLISLVSCPPAGLAGAIMGHLSRRQIAQRREEGAGMALAGIIVGWIGVALSAGLALFFFAILASSNSGY